MVNLAGRRALITGASRGLGAALSWELASCGADVIIVARSENRLRRLARAIRSSFRVDVKHIAVDLSSPVGVEHLFAQLGVEKIDILVNNAANVNASYVEEMPLQELQETAFLNFIGPVQLIQYLMPGMLRRNYGRILNVSSAASLIGLPGSALYSATKSALNVFTEGLRRELAGFDVSVTVLIPGVLKGASTLGPLSSIERLYRVSPFGTFTRLPRRLVAKKAVKAVIRGQPTALLTGWQLGLRLGVNRLFPGYVDRTFAQSFRPRESLALPGRPAAKVLVAGATGFIGMRLIRELTDAGCSVRALVRKRDKIPLIPAEVEVFVGTTFDPDGIRRAMNGIEIAYYLVHSMTEHRFEELDRQSATHFRDAALANNVQQVIYLGALRTTDSCSSRHLNSRYEVEKILTESSVPTTTLRAGLILGDGSATEQMLTKIVQHLPLIPYTRLMKTRIQPIAIADAIRYLVQCSILPSTKNNKFDIRKIPELAAKRG